MVLWDTGSNVRVEALRLCSITPMQNSGCVPNLYVCGGLFAASGGAVPVVVKVEVASGLRFLAARLSLLGGSVASSSLGGIVV